MQSAKVRIFPKSSLARPQHGRAVIGISLDSRTTKSPTVLRQVFDWTSRNLGAFDLLVGDYLNRHNYQALQGESESTAIKRAMHDGEEVTVRLRQIISEDYPNDTEVISAGSLFKVSSFAERLAHFERVYAKNVHFSVLVDQAVNAFLARKRSAVASDDNVRNHCIAYQLEELAMFELLADAGYSALVYAGPQLPVMKRIVSKSLDGVSRLLETLTLVEWRMFKPK